MYRINYFKMLKKEAEREKFKYPLTVNTGKGKYFLVVKTINYIKYAFVIASKRSKTYDVDEGLITESYFDKKSYGIYKILKNQYKQAIEKDIGFENEIIWQDMGESYKGTVCRIYIAKSLDKNDLTKNIKWHLNLMSKFLLTIQKYVNIAQNISFDENKNNIIYSNESLINDINNIIKTDIPLSTEKENLIKCRIGQGEFRDKLIDYWKGCSVTGLKQNDILIASHIKPWSKSNNKERLDLFNGLLLLPTIDKLFDKGYISFDENGNILISKHLTEDENLGINKQMKIDIKEEHKKYLQFHRSNIFKGI